MSFKFPIFVIFAVFLIINSCGNETAVPTQLTQTELTEVQQESFAKSYISQSDVYDFATMDLKGSSKLVRTPNGISMTLHTSDVNSGDAVTVWYVIFNNPSECGSSPCGEADIFNPATRTDVVYAAGHVVGNGNNFNVSGHRAAGDNSGSVLPFLNALLGTTLESVGLEDPTGAEVHLVVRSHGEAIPELLPDMFQTFNGGCIYPPGVPTVFGSPGPNTCQDIQFAIHQP